MKNAKHLLLLFVLFAGISLAVSAQRGRYDGRFRGHYGHEYAYRPSVRVNVGIGLGHVGYYRPYYRPAAYYGYYGFHRPSIGFVLSVLPFGYRTVYLGPNPYYYYDGIYYRPYAHNRYEVVDPPVGARIPELPAGAKAQVINGQKFYEYDGDYYREVITDNGNILYEVVGKNAVLNTEDSPQDMPPASVAPAPSAVAPSTNESVGMETERLPDNCKTIVINQQKYYQSPSGYYYQEVIKDNKLSYKIVGKNGDTN